MQNFIPAPHRGRSGAPVGPTGAPNAALLIDFDNVTMGIRSDLTRQLKELLNSDIIKGKVAVQRAYADWRRYAQYIVPLSEASVDLIFAPAYGSSKKNATDIRLAIDALELVFTRPEIGTFILLSGDSDFSSLVLKLKEYGKYVVGVGLRESASDLLVQNCDEYFSYSSLTGLTRAGEGGTVPGVDSWELAERAVNQMAADNDVMRSDRLKQVMLELDPTFDEGQLGFTKFNKFLVEAASRNRLALKKLENGQYEVQPFEAEAGGVRDDRGRGRGRRDRKDESRARDARAPAADSRTADGRVADAERWPQPRAEEPTPAQPRPEPAPRREAARPEPRPASREGRTEAIDQGYALLRRAVKELTGDPGSAARDSDIKRKMIELEDGWDEAALGFTKFSRFLRQAHDAEVVDLTRNPDGFYQARLSRGSARAEPPAQRDRDRDRDRGRRDRARPAAAPDTQDTRAQTVATGEEAPAERRREREQRRQRAATQVTEPAHEPAGDRDRGTPPEAPAVADEVAPAVAAEAAETAQEPAQPAAPSARPAGRGAGFGRRGRRGAGAEGPPPLLPGQVVGGETAAGGRSRAARAPAGTAATGSEAPSAAPAAEPGLEPATETPAMETPAMETPAVETPAVEMPAVETPAAGAPGAKVAAEPPIAESPAGDGATAGEPVAREAPGVSLVDPEALGLPTDRAAVIRYLSNSYQGVGQKTAEALIDTFGPDGVFQGLNDQPGRVREVLGVGRRTDALLDAWQRDFRRRTTAGQGGGAEAGAAVS